RQVPPGRRGVGAGCRRSRPQPLVDRPRRRLRAVPLVQGLGRRSPAKQEARSLAGPGLSSFGLELAALAAVSRFGIGLLAVGGLEGTEGLGRGRVECAQQAAVVGDGRRSLQRAELRRRRRARGLGRGVGDRREGLLRAPDQRAQGDGQKGQADQRHQVATGAGQRHRGHHRRRPGGGRGGGGRQGGRGHRDHRGDGGGGGGGGRRRHRGGRGGGGRDNGRGRGGGRGRRGGGGGAHDRGGGGGGGRAARSRAEDRVLPGRTRVTDNRDLDLRGGTRRQVDGGAHRAVGADG